MTTKTLTTIIAEAGLDITPGFYEGKTVQEGDITAGFLKTLYEQLRTSFGEQAGEGLIAMIKDLKCLHPSLFLSNLGQLEVMGWHYVAAKHYSETPELQQSNDGKYNVGGNPLFWPRMKPRDEDIALSKHIRISFLESLHLAKTL